MKRSLAGESIETSDYNAVKRILVEEVATSAIRRKGTLMFAVPTIAAIAVLFGMQLSALTSRLRRCRIRPQYQDVSVRIPSQDTLCGRR